MSVSSLTHLLTHPPTHYPSDHHPTLRANLSCLILDILFVPGAFLVPCGMLSLKHLHNVETRFYCPQAFPS